MTTNKLQATIKTKDGTRVFNLSLGSLSTFTQDSLSAFFSKKDSVGLEDLLSFCISQTEKIHQLNEKNSQIQNENKSLREESKRLQDEIEKLCTKLESL